MSISGLYIYMHVRLGVHACTHTHTTHSREEKQELTITEINNMPPGHFINTIPLTARTSLQGKQQTHMTNQTESGAEFLAQGQTGCNCGLSAVITDLTPDWNSSVDLWWPLIPKAFTEELINLLIPGNVSWPGHLAKCLCMPSPS